MLEVKVPSVGESITEVQIAQWLKQEGAWVAKDENIVDLETEKASVQIPAPVAGIIRNIRKKGRRVRECRRCSLRDRTIRSTCKRLERSTSRVPGVCSSESKSAEPARVMPLHSDLMGDSNLKPSQVQATGLAPHFEGRCSTRRRGDESDTSCADRTAGDSDARNQCSQTQRSLFQVPAIGWKRSNR